MVRFLGGRRERAGRSTGPVAKGVDGGAGYGLVTGGGGGPIRAGPHKVVATAAPCSSSSRTTPTAAGAAIARYTRPPVTRSTVTRAGPTQTTWPFFLLILTIGITPACPSWEAPA